MSKQTIYTILGVIVGVTILGVVIYATQGTSETEEPTPVVENGGPSVTDDWKDYRNL